MSHELLDYLLEQLTPLGTVRARRMFGAHGLYAGERMFAIFADGALWLKTDAQTRTAFTARGEPAFTYLRQGKPCALGFHRTPAEVLEDADELRRWARQALDVARRAAARRG